MRRLLTNKEQAVSGGEYLNAGMVFMIPSELVSGPQLMPGLLIIDGDGTTWTTQTADFSYHGQAWKCTCLNLTIVYELCDLLTIERSSIPLDNVGAIKHLYLPDGGEIRYQDIKGSVQPQEADSTDERGMRGMQTRYTVPVEFEIEVDMDRDRVKWTDPHGHVRYLDMVAYRNAESISTLPELECFLRP